MMKNKNLKVVCGRDPKFVPIIITVTIIITISIIVTITIIITIKITITIIVIVTITVIVQIVILFEEKSIIIPSFITLLTLKETQDGKF
jgi:hypothetical protein